MVRNTAIALRALHEALVAARNMALENPGTTALVDIVDTIEAVPLWIADADTDYTDDVITVFEHLRLEYPDCAMAARTAARLRTY